MTPKNKTQEVKNLNLSEEQTMWGTYKITSSRKMVINCITNPEFIEKNFQGDFCEHISDIFWVFNGGF